MPSMHHATWSILCMGMLLLTGCEKRIPDHSQIHTNARDYQIYTDRNQSQYVKAHQCLYNMSKQPYIVLFNEASAVIPRKYHRALDQAANCLKSHQHAHIGVIVEGFASQKGNDQFNARLSLKRANVVRKALIARGVPKERIIVRGLGVVEKFIPHIWQKSAETYNRRANLIPVDLNENILM